MPMLCRNFEQTVKPIVKSDHFTTQNDSNTTQNDCNTNQNDCI